MRDRLIKKDFAPLCQACDITMTHWSKDYRTVSCTSCWESIPVPLDCVPNYVKLNETRRLRSMVESREADEEYKPYRPTRRRR